MKAFWVANKEIQITKSVPVICTPVGPPVIRRHPRLKAKTSRGDFSQSKSDRHTNED